MGLSINQLHGSMHLRWVHTSNEVSSVQDLDFNPYTGALKWSVQKCDTTQNVEA
jgi:hypothetical protein